MGKKIERQMEGEMEKSKKRRIAAGICSAGIILLLSSCGYRTENPGELGKETVGPYSLSVQQKEILEAFGMKDTSCLLSFWGPKEAVSLHVRVYERREEGEMPDPAWKEAGGGSISLGQDPQAKDCLEGTVAMERKKDGGIEFHISSIGMVSFETEAVELEREPVISSWKFLQEPKEIQLEKEIPVAIMAYDSGSSMRSYSPEDYFEPSVFQGLDLVQAVTFTFSSEE